MKDLTTEDLMLIKSGLIILSTACDELGRSKPRLFKMIKDIDILIMRRLKEDK